MATEFGGPTPKGGTEIQIPHAILEPLQQIKLTYQHESKHKDSLLRNRLGVNKSNANSGMKTQKDAGDLLLGPEPAQSHVIQRTGTRRPAETGTTLPKWGETPEWRKPGNGHSNGQTRQRF